MEPDGTDYNWDESGEFDIDSMNTWQSMDNFLQEPPKLLDDPEDFSQDFF